MIPLHAFYNCQKRVCSGKVRHGCALGGWDVRCLGKGDSNIMFLDGAERHKSTCSSQLDYFSVPPFVILICWKNSKY